MYRISIRHSRLVEGYCGVGKWMLKELGKITRNFGKWRADDLNLI